MLLMRFKHLNLISPLIAIKSLVLSKNRKSRGKTIFCTTLNSFEEIKNDKRCLQNQVNHQVSNDNDQQLRYQEQSYENKHIDLAEIMIR